MSILTKEEEKKDTKQVDEKIKEEALKAYGKAAQVKVAEKQAQKEEEKAETEKTEEKEKGISTDVIDEELSVISLELERVKAERDDFLDHLRRLKAEFENYKKRLIKEQTLFMSLANEELIVKLLSVVDNLERAIDFASNQENQEFAKTLEGFRLIFTQLMDILQKEGLEEIKTEGEHFDPEFHEALISEESDLQPDTVIRVIEKGYKLKDKVLRPAKVIVSR